MSDNNEKNAISRRKLLKGLAASGGVVIAGKSLPENWSRPVVDSVMLPAHAQTSPGASLSYTGTALTAIPSETRMARLIGGMVNEAHAGNDHTVDSVCINSNPAGTAVSVDAIVRWSTHDISTVTAPVVPVGGAPVTMTTNECPTSHNLVSLETLAPVALIDKLGLIKDAKAGFAHVTPVTVQVDSVGGMAVGRFLVDGNDTISFNLPPGGCSAPVCPPPLPP